MRPANQGRPGTYACSAPLQILPGTRKTSSSASSTGREPPVQLSRHNSLLFLGRVSERCVQIEFSQSRPKIRVVRGIDDARILNKLEQSPLPKHLRDLLVIAERDDFWVLAEFARTGKR